MALSLACSPVRRFAAGLLIVGCSVNLFAAGTGSSGGQGMRLLQAQLPAGITIQGADCEQLVRAVRRATLGRHQEAAGILSAALDTDKDRSGKRREARRDCACVSRLFRAAVAAAPDHASELLETAQALCPECGDALSAALDRLSDKNVVADPHDPDSGLNPGSAVKDPNATPAGLSDRDYHGIGLADTGNSGDPGSSSGPGTVRGNAIGGDPSVSGFGVGLGASFPGSPGFSGSTATGSFALPPPVAPAVTSAVNG